MASLVVMLLVLTMARPSQAIDAGPNAGNGGTAIPQFPNGPVTVGQTIDAELALQVTSTNAVFSSEITDITLIPSCPDLDGCPPGVAEGGVFALSPVGVGVAGTACAGTTFSITEGPPGVFTFSPQGPPVILAEMGRCVIAFQATVLKVPAVDLAPGEPGVQTNQVASASATPIGVDQTRFRLSGTDSITIFALPTINVVKTADPVTLPEPGGTVTYTVVVTNTGPQDVTITDLVDDRFGDLADDPNNDLISNTDCGLAPGTPLAADPPGVLLGGSFTCTFDAQVTGSANDPPHVNVVTATAVDDLGNTATDDDDATVTLLDVLPTIVVDKTVVPGTRPEPGGTFTYTVVVTNTSPEPVTITSLNDNRFGDLDDPLNTEVTDNTCLTAVDTVLAADPPGVAPGGSFTCTFNAQVTGSASDLPHVNIVTAIAEDDEGNPATDNDDATVDLTDALPSIIVDKTVAPGTLPEPGGTFTYTVVVTNTSPEPVTITSLVDDKFGNLDDPLNTEVTDNTCLNAVDTVLAADPPGAAPGGSFTCTFKAEVTGLASDPDHVNTVTAIAEDDEGNPATDNDDATVNLTDNRPLIDVNKSVTPGVLPEPGGTFRFTVVVTNPGPRDVTITDLVDDRFGDLDDEDNDLVTNSTCLTAVGTPLAADTDGAGPQLAGSLTCAFDAQVIGQASDPPHVDVVTVTAEDDDGNEVEADDDATVDLTDLLPVISVDKTASPGSVPAPGGEVRFTVVVRNVGPDAVTITELTDNVFGNLDDPANALVSNTTCLAAVGTPLAADPDGTGPQLGGSFTCAFDGQVTGSAGSPPHVDVVTADAVDSEGNPATDDDDATVTFTGVLAGGLPTVRVVKTGTPETMPAPGGDFTFNVVVTNTSVGNVSITTLTDDIYGNIATQGTCTNAIGTVLVPGGTYSCSFTGRFTGAPRSQTDVVTVVVTDEDGDTATDTDDATVTITPVGAPPPSPPVVVDVVRTAMAVVAPVVQVAGERILARTGASVAVLVSMALGLVALGGLLVLTAPAGRRLWLGARKP